MTTEERQRAIKLLRVAEQAVEKGQKDIPAGVRRRLLAETLDNLRSVIGSLIIGKDVREL